MRATRGRFTLAAAFLALAAGLCALSAKWSLISRYGSDVPFWDQWDGEARVLLIPHAEGRLDAEAFWRAHNEHHIVFTKLINYGLVLADRQWDPLLEMTVNALFPALTAALFMLMASRLVAGWRLGVLALVVAACFSLPFDAENALAGFQSQFFLLELLAFAGLWALLPARPLGGRWWCGYALLVASLGTMSTGFFAAAAALVPAAAVALQRPSARCRAQLAALGLLAAVCVAGALTLVRVPGHAPLAAKGPADLLSAAAHALSWPTHLVPWTALLIQAPAALLIARCVRRRRLEAEDLVPAGLILWTWAQIAALAYGRGHAHFIEAGRYTDLFAFSVCVNGLAAARLLVERSARRTALAGLWLGCVGAGLLAETRTARHWLDRDFAPRRRLERRHVRDYTIRGEAAKLLSAPQDELPFPFAAPIIAVVDAPGMRALLSQGLRPPIALKAAPGSTGFSRGPSGPPPGGPDIACWRAERGPASFTSEPLPAGSLPVLHLELSGAASLSSSVFWLEDERGERTPLEIRRFAGNRWQPANLRLPPGRVVRLRAELPAGAGPLAFSEPVETGLYSWIAHTVRKGAGPLGAAAVALYLGGLVLMAVGRDREVRP